MRVTMTKAEDDSLFDGAMAVESCAGFAAAGKARVSC
jgi:hypothetical protein